MPIKSYLIKHPKQKKYLFGLSAGIAFSVLISLFYLFGFFTKLQYISSDILSLHFTLNPQKSCIIYLIITDATIIEADEVDGIQWPWPRQAYGEAIKFLKNAGAKAIVFDIVFFETSREGPEDDEVLAEYIKSGDVILANFSTNRQGNASMEKISHNDELMKRYRIPVEIKEFNSNIKEIKYFRLPVDTLFNAMYMIGDVKFMPDSDGIGRRMSLLFKKGENFYPSLSLAVASSVLNINKVFLTGNNMILSSDTVEQRIPLGKEGMVRLKYYGESSVYEKYLLLRLIKSQVRIDEGESPYYDPSIFKDKIVMIVSDSTELKDLRPNPFNKFNDVGGHYHGTAIDNILKGEFLREFYQPELVIPLLLILAALTSFITANFNAYWGLSLAVFLIFINLTVGVFLYRNFNILTEISATNIVIIGSFMFTGIVNYLIESQQKFFIINAFGQYLSPRVIDELVKDPSKLKLGGEERIMTAYFSDIAGFSGISEKLLPQELVSLLNYYLSEMCEVIGKYEGTVDKFEGDAIIAFWGAPIPTEEHALLACKASLEMNSKLVEIRENLKKEGKPELYVRMGINSGPMVVGNMGSHQRMDFTMMGDSVNIASRLEGANKFYGTYLMISEFTYGFVKDKVEVKELDLIRVIGKNEPIRVYELLAMKGELPENFQKGRDIFEEALGFYRKRKFQEAKNMFGKVFEFVPGDPPAKIYLQRCADFIKIEPPHDWDGVFQLTSKG